MANMAKLFTALVASEDDRSTVDHALPLFVNRQRRCALMIAWRRFWSSAASCCSATSASDDDNDDNLPNRLYSLKWIDRCPLRVDD